MSGGSSGGAADMSAYQDLLANSAFDFPWLKKEDTFNGYIAPGKTIQPYFPGQEGLLSQQMAAGFGSSPESVEGLLAALYGPVTVGLGADGKIAPGGSAVKMGGGDTGSNLPTPLGWHSNSFFTPNTVSGTGGY